MQILRSRSPLSLKHFASHIMLSLQALRSFILKKRCLRVTKMNGN